MSDVVIDQHPTLAAQGTIDNLPWFEGRWSYILVRCARKVAGGWLTH